MSTFDKSQILQRFRRRLSICAVKSQAACLLSRLSHFGEAAQLVAKRRDKARVEEDFARRDIRAHWEANVRGRRISAGLLHL